MYKDFYRLHQLPFDLTPDPAFLFLPPKHREALAGMTYSILERKGFIVLTGDAGTGKTTLINAVFSHLPAGRVESSVLLNPTLTPAEFLEGVLLDLDMEVPPSKAQRLWKLQEFLARVHRENRLVILVIDEAHKLSPELLEEVRLLGNFESPTGKYLQVLLSGQSELDDLLNRHDLRQFKQRIAMRLYIDRLSPNDVERYIAFRWSKAGGGQTVPFAPEAMAGIVRWSQGIPRVINLLCDNSLLMAFAAESQVVDIEFVRTAALNLALTDSVSADGLNSVGSLDGDGDRTPILVAHPPDRIAAPEGSATGMTFPTLSRYIDPKPNSSLLKRLAERLGLPR